MDDDTLRNILAYVEARGLNLKFTDLQAVVGLEQMKKLPARVARMRAMWFAYRRGLDGVDGLTMLGAPESDPGWIPWFVDVRVDDGMEAREDLALFLKQHGVGTRSMYPRLSHQPALRDHAGAAALRDHAAVQRAADSMLFLPSSASYDDSAVELVCGLIRLWAMGRRPQAA